MDSNIITVSHHLHLVVAILKEFWSDTATLRMFHVTAYSLKTQSVMKHYF